MITGRSALVYMPRAVKIVPPWPSFSMMAFSMPSGVLADDEGQSFLVGSQTEDDFVHHQRADVGATARPYNADSNPKITALKAMMMPSTMNMAKPWVRKVNRARIWAMISVPPVFEPPR
jgi:hypothetical protein